MIVYDYLTFMIIASLRLACMCTAVVVLVVLIHLTIASDTYVCNILTSRKFCPGEYSYHLEFFVSAFVWVTITCYGSFIHPPKPQTRHPKSENSKP